MSNELATIDNLSYEQIAALTGQSTGGGSTGLPRVGMNKDPGPNEDKPLPVRSLKVELPEVGLVYGKKAIFRPYLNRFQYQHYDGEAPNPKTGKKGVLVGVTKVVKDFREELIDTNGGIRLGRPDGKTMKTLSDDEKKKYKNIRCYRRLFGTLTMDAVDAEGNKHKVEALPVEWRLAGKNFMGPSGDGIDDVLKGLDKQKKHMFNFGFEPELERMQNGDTVYYVIHWKIDQTKFLPFGPEDMDLLRKFNETVEAENARIIEAYNKAIRGEALDDAADKFMEEFGADDLPEDI